MPQDPYASIAQPLPSAPATGGDPYSSIAQPVRPNHAINAANETIGDTSHLSDTDVVNNFAKGHPIAGPIVRGAVAGGAAVGNTIAGAPGAIRHAATDVSTGEDAGLPFPERFVYRLFGGHEIAQAAQDYANKNSPVYKPGAVKSVLPEAVGTGIGTVAGGAAMSKLASPVVKAVKGAGTIADAYRESPSVTSSIDELTKTRPEDLAKYRDTTAKAENIRQTIVQAEHTAHTQASAAFPDVPGEIVTKETPVQSSILDANGKPVTTMQRETTNFRDLQETRSGLLKQIADEQNAVSKGATPRYDLADLQAKRAAVDALMDKLATDAGVKPQLEKARALYSKYMDDFHNSGSPLRRVLEAEPGETNKITNHFLNQDNGARAIEVMRDRGIPTKDVESLISKGSQPLRESVAEASKLRKAGSEEAYKTQRRQEALDQAVTNRLPGGAEAKLPRAAMAHNFRGEVPGATPRRITEIRLRNDLSNRANPSNGKGARLAAGAAAAAAGLKSTD